MSGGGNADLRDTEEDEQKSQMMIESKKKLMSAQSGARRKRTTYASDYIQGPVINYHTGGKNPLVKTGGGSQFNEKDLFQANNIYNYMDKHQHIY